MGLSERENQHKALRVAAFLAFIMLVASCGWNDPGPRVRVHNSGAATGSVPTSQPAVRTPAVLPAGGVHTVRRGESLYAISQQYGVPLRALIVRNDLQPPYRLFIGQEIVVPVARFHQVVRGDTLYGISRRYGVSLDALVRLNGIAPPYEIHVGQRLNLPGAVTRQVAARVPNNQDISVENLDAGAPEGTPRARPKPAHVPAKNDDVPVPGDTTVQQPSPQPKNPPQIAFSVTDAGYPRPRVKPLPPRRAHGALPSPPGRAASKFLWPVRGRVLSTFGSKGKGLHNDGLNIAAPRGAPVRAAENGVVAFSGSELKGFGNMILIKHADGYLTAYAHNEEILVRRGEVIQRGQTIARVGSTGNVDSPQLHFQVRRRSKSVNPLRHLEG